MKLPALLIVSGFACLALVGCTKQNTPTSSLPTGMLFSGEQSLTGMTSDEVFSQTDAGLREELTGDTTASLTITGQLTPPDISTGADTSVQTGETVQEDIKSLVETYSPKGEDPKEDHENMVDFIDQIIKKVETIGN